MTVILIPALDPDMRLVHLVAALRQADSARAIVIVDDGSAPEAADVFERASHGGARVVHHEVNRGKGAALRTGIAVIMRDYPDQAVVTADSDGQHTPDDVERIARQLDISERAGARDIVLGARAFTGTVPARSQLGNRAMRLLYRAATGTALTDTQTGLRGIPHEALPWAMSLPGDRFEYEFHMLLRARGAGYTLVEVPIATVYLEQNASSHFRPVVDSARVFAPLGRFAASSLTAFAIDAVMLLVLNALTGWLLFSVVGARLTSASINFALNRRMVFAGGRDVPLRSAILRYTSLAVLLLAANFGALTALTDAGVPLLLAKLLTEAALFAVSFTVQRSVVFASGTPAHTNEPAMELDSDADSAGVSEKFSGSAQTVLATLPNNR